VVTDNIEFSKSLSVILPAQNEAKALAALLPRIRQLFPNAEIIVVDDGSRDDTATLCRTQAVRLVSHPYGIGNGAAIKSGARAATRETLLFLDADGQHSPDDIPKLLSKLRDGFDMAVGARSAASQASPGRFVANTVYNVLASWMVGQRIEDLTSGFRAVVRDKFLEFIHLLPNGFSYPTTITMSFFRAGYSVGYVPIAALQREGASHIRPLRDGARFFLIIFRVGTLYSPLKIFIPVSLAFFLLGLSYYAYTFLTEGRFTNMSALLLSTSVLIFLIGLVSEQITNLLYSYKRG
jgi:glycosyltransferase involved in cell wall biosynthesis